MSDAGPFDAVKNDPPEPWGPRTMGSGAGLRQVPNDPNSTDMMGRDQISERVQRLESDHRALLMAFGAAFVILIGTFGAGYLALAAKIDAGFAQVGQKADTLSTAISQVHTDVAVLKERSSNTSVAPDSRTEQP